jgi:hypothetical protein
MKNDPRVAQQPMFVSSQNALDASLMQLMVDDPSFAEMYVRKQEAQRLRDLQREQQAAHQMLEMNKAMQNVAAQSSAFGAINADLLKNFKFPKLGQGQDHLVDAARYAMQSSTPPPLDEESPRADAAQDQGIAKMNPIARHRFEGIIKLMGIKVRYTTASMSRDVHQWILARMGKDGRMIRQEWTAPSKDPGCSLRTWEAMIGEFLDEVARRDGIEIPTDTDKHNGPSGAGNEASGSTGNT